MNYLYTNRRSVGIFGGLLLLILFSCCGIGRAAAQQQGAEQRITLSMRDTAISDILENITKRYQYAFITRTANVDTNARVSIDVVDEPLRAVLDRIFAGQEVAFEFDGRLVRISKAAVPPPPPRRRSRFRASCATGRAIRWRALRSWWPEPTRALPPTTTDAMRCVSTARRRCCNSSIWAIRTSRRPSANARRSTWRWRRISKWWTRWSSSATVPSRARR